MTAVSTIPYTPSMQANYGPVPKVDVYYRDENMNWTSAGIFTQVQFDGNTILVDHGGSGNRWMIKVS